ncbi:carbohydrate ABC transporter permease [Treponema brennaborense]|uniref:ABC-type transporter, integral membrane subunit n=1 Tax=Treponema brennaborense (strain DSM 12168 / CIP 105900 / DD5/3) TaxID=906968 RepID=F4LKP1_TREBD|nr:sugar ABC transporter permease [Treponema brennaborense]AEE15502.1 ABC-type transporter, integral membrane subunit [Treponema brennaborense DSM 12168]
MHTYGLSGKRKEFLWGWAFLLPTVIGLLILNIIPVFQTIWQSFFKTGAFGRGNQFIGIQNFVKLAADKTVWQALLNTCKYTLVEVPFSVIFALIAAVLLNCNIRGRSAFRTIYFLPMVAAPAAVAMVWRWLYNSEFGLLNQLLQAIGGPRINWISDPHIAFISVAFVGVWSVTGYNMILFLAGLQEIPSDFYEAAEIDGASVIRQFFSITLPQLSATMFFVSVTRVMAALQVFDTFYIMIDRTNPAAYKTQSLVYLFYKYSFIESNKGYGSAIVLLLLAVIMIITAIQVYFQKKWNASC